MTKPNLLILRTSKQAWSNGSDGQGTIEEKRSSLENASKLAGISRPTIYAWKKKYKGFAKRLEEALARQEINLVSCIYKSDDWRAQAFLLERRFLDRWSKNRKVEVNRSEVESKLSELQELAFLGIIKDDKD